ncbi:MAG TPA: porin [Steroidobacteraceae bacterium]|jgi:predicted porin|nr:porin [Steroidobacteraceae bacterium]
MQKFQLRKPILAAMGACAAMGISPGSALADNQQDIQQLKDQVRVMQQKIDDLSSQPAKPAKAAPSGSGGSLTLAGVTLYGTVDLGVAYLTHGAPVSQTWGPGLPYFIQNFSNHSILSVAGNGLSQSKVGISGVEHLFGDFSGVFRVETGFNPWSGRLTDGPASLVADNGKAAAVKISAGDSSRAGQAFNGAVYAGVSSKSLGTLTFGRQNGLMLDMLGKYDPQLQAQAFSPIALSGTSGGLGDTQSNRLDNSIKYLLSVGPGHVTLMHGFGSDGYVPQSSNEINLGMELGGFSIDALWGMVHGEVAAASLSAAQVLTQPVGSLAATVSDNTGYSVQMSYNAKEYFPIKLYAGWERIKYNNPSHPIPAGSIDIGGYLLSVPNNAAFNIQKIFVISWIGARWSVTPALDLTLAGYGYNQKSFAANGCTDASATSCAGELHDISLVSDYHFTKRFDGYAGVNYSSVSDGLASGFLFKNDWTPMVGVRFNF